MAGTGNINFYMYYIKYLRNNYGTNAVFDGYNSDCTNVAERNRRSMEKQFIDYIIDSDMAVQTAQEKFLLNYKNKSFIIILKEKLEENNILYYQVDNDTDTLIAQTAIDLSFSNVAVLAEDVDIFVILTALTQKKGNILLNHQKVKFYKKYIQLH